jgi:hypothetical protein
MSIKRDPDAILVAWLEDGPTRLPDATRRAIRVAARSTDQRRRPARASWRLPFMNTYARLAVAAIVVVAVGAMGLALLRPAGSTGPGGVVLPSATPTPAPSISPTSAPSAAIATPAAPPQATPAPTSVAFNSDLYGYRLALPTGWSAAPARVRWDGTGQPAYNDPSVDRFSGSPSLSTFGFAAPTGLALNVYADDVIARTAQFHGDTCPDPPKSRESITVGGSPARFIAFDCGLLINIVVVVHNGTGYEFVMRDTGVNAATDPHDRSALDAILGSVKFAP